VSENKQMTIIEKLSANILEARFEDLDRAIIDNTKNRIIDTLGCVIGGAKAPGNKGMVDLVLDWGGKEEATILAHGGKGPAQNAAMVNAMTARSFDFEVMSCVVDGKLLPSHNSATTVMTALAMGEMKGVTGKELITALLTGDDITARILAAADRDFLLGFDWTGTVTMFGATAIAGRLLGLNKTQMRHAFGIVLNQIASTMQVTWDCATTFKLHLGTAARNGIFAAELAKAGWTGAEDALFSRFGYFNIFTHGCNYPEILTRDLGKKFYAESLFKPYPCGWPNHGPIDCGLALAKKHSINPDEIEEVTIRMLPRLLTNYYAQPFRLGSFPQANAIFSYQYNLATALIYKCVKLQHFTEEYLHNPQVYALIKKIKLTAMPNFEDNNTEVVVRMNDGHEFSEYVSIPKGSPLGQPLTKDEIIAKYREQVAFSGMVANEDSEKLLALLESLEKVDNVRKIAELAVRRNPPRI
jgi:2-methylcitrate dehydratase PrpD